MAAEFVHDPRCSAFDVIECVQPNCPCECHDIVHLELPPRHGVDLRVPELIGAPA